MKWSHERIENACVALCDKGDGEIPADLPYALMVEYGGQVHHAATLPVNFRTEEFFYRFITVEANFQKHSALGRTKGRDCIQGETVLR
jgi:hypothetical protein